MTDDRLLQIEASIRHPQWIPGQTYSSRLTSLIIRGQQHNTVDSSLPDPRINELASADEVFDLFSAAIEDYQGVHMLLPTGEVYFPYSFNLAVGSQVVASDGSQHVVTTVLNSRDGSSYWNPYYRLICGQVVKLSPQPQFDAVLRLKSPANVYYVAAFPSEEIKSYLETSQMAHPRGFSVRFGGSQPFVPDNRVSQRYGFIEGQIRHPSRSDLSYEVTRYDEEAAYEVLAFSSSRVEADQLQRYSRAVLRGYRAKFKEAGIIDLFWAQRLQDDVIESGSQGWPFKTTLHIRRDKWSVRVSETLLSMHRNIDRIVIGVTPATFPLRYDRDSGEVEEGQGSVTESAYPELDSV